MTDHTSTPSRRAAFYAAGVAIVIAGGAFLYGKGGDARKEQGASVAPGCATTQAKAAELAGLAHGEVAAMTLSRDIAPMPAIRFVSEDGAQKTLKDFAGKTLLLNLWATWCVPCRAEMPMLDRLQGELGSDRFEVVAINVDASKPEKTKAFLDEIAVKHLARNTGPDLFYQLKSAGVVGLPATFLVDGAGCQLGMMAGPANWNSAEGKALLAAASARP